MRPILVTGASGTVGAAVVRRLTTARVAVRAASRRAEADDGSAVRFDFTDETTWPSAFSGVSTVFVVRPPQLGDVERSVVPALRAARDAGVVRVVLLSVQGADRVPVLPHARLERWVRGSGLAWTFLRPSFFCQNLTGPLAADLRERDAIIVPAGDGRVAFVDADDVAEVAADALLDPGRHTGRAWTLTGPQALRYREVAELLSAELGRPIRYARPGLPGYLRHARSELGMPTAMAAVTSVIHSTARLGLAGRLTDDLERLLGRPGTSLADYLHRSRASWSRTDGAPPA